MGSVLRDTHRSSRTPSGVGPPVDSIGEYILGILLVFNSPVSIQVHSNIDAEIVAILSP